MVGWQWRDGPGAQAYGFRKCPSWWHARSKWTAVPNGEPWAPSSVVTCQAAGTALQAEAHGAQGGSPGASHISSWVRPPERLFSSMLGPAGGGSIPRAVATTPPSAVKEGSGNPPASLSDITLSSPTVPRSRLWAQRQVCSVLRDFPF